MKFFNRAFESMSPTDIGQVDLVFADPPDNIGLGYEGYTDKLPTKTYERLMMQWLQLAQIVCHGPIFWCFNERWIYAVERAISDLRIPLIQRCFWRFTFGQCQKKRYTTSLRPVYWLNNPTFYPDRVKVPSARQEKYGDKRAEPTGRVPDNCWDFSRVCGTFHERRSWHPCQIPEALVERVILGHSQSGQVVLDPFLGSGTTAIVCARTDRQCIGVELSKKYYHEAQKELSSATMNQKRRGKR